MVKLHSAQSQLINQQQVDFDFVGCTDGGGTRLMTGGGTGLMTGGGGMGLMVVVRD